MHSWQPVQQCLPERICKLQLSCAVFASAAHAVYSGWTSCFCRSIVCATFLCVQADNPNPTASYDDESVIDRMVAQLQEANKGLPAGYKLQPVQFEKVRLTKHSSPSVQTGRPNSKMGKRH